MDRSVSMKRSWGGVVKKLICATASAALAVAMVPATALATDAMSTFYELPGASDVIDFTHQGTDDEGHTYNYHYVTVGLEGQAYANVNNAAGNSTQNRIAPMNQTYFEVLGLNYISAYRGPDTIFTWNHTQAEAADAATENKDSIDTKYTQTQGGKLTTRNASLAILGTVNNEVPDEYIWNYCCWANGATVADTQMVQDCGNEGLAYISVKVGDTTYTNYPRQIYWETDIIQAENADATAGAGSDGNALKWSEWVKLEQQRSGGSADYNPAFAQFATKSGSASAMVAGLHTLAEAIDEVVAKNKDANGNYTLQSRYGGNSADGTSTMISAYEDIVQAPEYYTLSKIADNTVSKKVTAVLVGYDPDTGNYACRKYGTDKDPEGNQYGGRVANYLAPISTSITEKLGESASGQTAIEKEQPYIVWYTPKQIAENCDAAFVCDCYDENKVSTYLATASDGKCHTVYSTKISTEITHDYDRTEALEAARAELIAAGKDACDFCYSYPCTMFGNFYAQGVENGMISLVTCAYTYPEIFTGGIADLFAYWAKNVWHIKDSSLSSIVHAATADMHLSDGETVGDVSADYDTNAKVIFLLGNNYYLDNADEIDAINGGCLKTYDRDQLKARVQSMSQSQFGLSVIDTLNSELTDAKAEVSRLEGSNKTAASELAAAKDQVNALQTQISSLQGELTAAKASASSSSSASEAIETTVTVNKATVKAADIPTTAKAVILGAKVKKVSAKAFAKAKSVKTVVVQSKKLKKAKVKNCFKSSKVKTVQVPGSKYKAYKKIFTKKNCGKKVSIL